MQKETIYLGISVDLRPIEVKADCRLVKIAFTTELVEKCLKALRKAQELAKEFNTPTSVGFQLDDDEIGWDEFVEFKDYPKLNDEGFAIITATKFHNSEAFWVAIDNRIVISNSGELFVTANLEMEDNKNSICINMVSYSLYWEKWMPAVGIGNGDGKIPF